MTRPALRNSWPGPRSWLKFLRPHQSRAIAAALVALEGRGRRLEKQRRGVILADDVGMGKTFEGIGAAVLFISRLRTYRPPVFLVPPGLRLKWHAEFEKFLEYVRKENQPASVARTLRRLTALLESDQLIVPTSQAWRLARSRRCRQVPLLLLDEAHKARKKENRLSQALERILRRSTIRRGPAFLFLTATPFQCDHHRELVHLLSLLDRGWDHEYKPGTKLAEPKGSLPAAPSLVNAIQDGLHFLDRRLTEVLEKDPDRCEVELAKLLDILDRNHDLDHDPEGKSFGIGEGHDGLDEYLRSLIVRTPKPQPIVTADTVPLTALDTSLYLFGKAYLRAHARGLSGTGDPPPGGGYLPNAYSRLCSAHRALIRHLTLATKGTQHPHASALRTLALGEKRPGVNGSAKSLQHAKLRLLVKRLEEALFGGGNPVKAVIFFNHRLSLAQVKDVLRHRREIISRLAAVKPGSKDYKPRVSALRTSSKLVRRRSWFRLKKRLSQWLESEELIRIESTLLRNVALVPVGQRKLLAAFWIEILERLAQKRTDELLSDGQLRREIRGHFEKPDRKASRRRLRRLRIRHFKPVEQLDGSVDMAQRERLLMWFNSKGVPPYILLVSQAGSEGQDMHRACRDVIHYDLHWNPTVIHQRTGRVYRDMIDAKDIRVRRLDFQPGYDFRILEYARSREAYQDFLLGEKKLAEFLEAIGQDGFSSTLDTPVFNRARGWRMDLTPDPIRK
jgi:hypothetical protein